MTNAQRIGIIIVGVIFAALVGWISTAPYLSNQGLGRTPGLIIGGNLTETPDDFTYLNDTVQGPLLMKQAGFPPFVNYLSWVGTPEGIITATRPDGGLWAQRVRDRGGDGWLRVGDETFELEAIEILDERRIPMMQQWADKAGRGLDEPLYAGSEPLREWKSFSGNPRNELNLHQSIT